MTHNLMNINIVEKHRLVRHPDQEIILFSFIFVDIARVQLSEKLIVNNQRKQEL